MTSQQKQDYGFKFLTLALAVGGSVLSSYTATRMTLATLDSRITGVEKKVEIMDARKLDIRHHDELVGRLEAGQVQNSSDHQKILEMLVEISGKRNR